MGSIGFGILFLVFSVFLYFVSPIYKKNTLGYKSMQQGMHKDIWKMSNKCFGLLAMIGSSIYLAMAITFRILDMKHYNALLNQCGIFYIFTMYTCHGSIYFYKFSEREEIVKIIPLRIGDCIWAGQHIL